MVTDAGVTGFSFAGPPPETLALVKDALVGADLFNVNVQLQNGLWKWGGVEHAVWDAIGKIANRPVYQLLGGASDRVTAYLTCVWKGAARSIAGQLRRASRHGAQDQARGLQGHEDPCLAADPLDDVEVCRRIKTATGSDFYLMFDRTAEMPVSMAGNRCGISIRDCASPASCRTRARIGWKSHSLVATTSHRQSLPERVDILITGGEAHSSLAPCRDCLLHRTYDILQPDGRQAGGIFRCRQVAVLAEAFHVPAILHGSMSLPLAGWLQATLAIGSPLAGDGFNYSAAVAGGAMVARTQSA